MKKLILLNIIILCCFYSTYSQVAVISEYMNQSGTPDGEWTEILILENNVNLSNYSIRDNSDTNSWRPAAVFKSIPLWSNLQKGTIIVIMHRSTGTVLDVDPSDGYIEVAASDPNYFNTPPTWDADGSLSINQTNDMIQLLDASGNNVHTLGHTASVSSKPYNDFTSINGAKLMYNGSLSNGNSLRVYPGASISDYEMGFDASKQYTVANNSYSKGFPNANVGSTNTNHLFWRALRQPDWTNSSINTSASVIANKVKITWNPAAPTMNSDEGYIIIRIPSNQRNLATPPIDGKIYNTGDFIGSGTVVGTVYNLNQKEFTDNDFSKAECGQDYFYRIYAFRYNADNQGKDFQPENARGRSYNENNFAETPTVSKLSPDKPIISTLDNRNTFCEGENVFIQVNGNYTSDITFQWYKDGLPISNATSSKLKVNASGQYYVTVTNLTSLCQVQSDIVDIQILPSPQAFLYIVSNQQYIQITKDTTIFVCKDADPSFDYPRLHLEGANTREWYFDGKLKNEELNKVETIAVQKGSYFGVVKNGICADTTPKVFIDYFNLNLVFNPSTAVFDADDSPVQTITIQNLSNTDITLLESDFQIPKAFTFENTTFPIIIPKNGSQSIQIRYTRTTPGTDISKLYLNVICSQTYRLNLQGVKKVPGTAQLLSIPDTLNFGTITTCDAINGISKQLMVKSVGTIPLTLHSPVVDTQVSFDNSLFPKTLDTNATFQFNINIIQTNEGIYSGILAIPYESVEKNPKQDTMLIPWTLEIVKPKLDFSPTVACSIATCSDTAYQTLDITNNTKIPISITKNFINSSQVSILEPLPISFNPQEKKTITIRVVSNQNINLNDTLEYEPCTTRDQISISATKSNISITTNNSNIDFGVVPACSNSNYESTQKATITVSGGAVKVKDIQIQGPFALDLNPGDIINSTQNITFKYQGTQPGQMQGKITLTFDPCDYVLVYNISAQGVVPSITINPDSLLDFGFVQQSVLNSKTITITNTSPFNISVNISSSSSEFQISSDLISPITLKPDETQQVTINFKSDNPDTFSSGTLNLLVEPCDEVFSIKLSATTANNVLIGKIQADMPQEITGKIGQTVNVPITFTPNFNLADANIGEIAYYFSYDGVLLYPKNVTPLNQNSWINNSSVVLSENNINNSILVYDLKGNTPPNNNNWLNLNLQVLLLQSNLEKGKITLDSVIFVTKSKISIENDSTIINVPKQCELENRTIYFDQTSQIPIIYNTNDQVDIKFQTIADGNVSINIISTTGEIMQSQTFTNVRQGEYKTQLDISNLQSGVYLIEIKTATSVFVQKIIILR
jgi:hypothetical protein